MRFIPKRPYRCLHCYHRFWKWESPFASSKRIWSWAIILAILCFLLLSNGQSKPPEQVEIGSFYGASELGDHVTGDPPVSLAETTSGGEQNQALSARQGSRLSTSNQKLNPAQIERQLAQARLEAEQAKQQNEAKRAQLRESMAAERAELESLLKVDIGYHIENWRKSWQAGNVERYLDFYSSKFVPRNDVSRERWSQLRRERVLPSKNISLELSNFRVQFSDNHRRATVQFDQFYRAGRYKDTSRKQLVLLKEQQEWKIVSETEVNN